MHLFCYSSDGRRYTFDIVSQLHFLSIYNKLKISRKSILIIYLNSSIHDHVYHLRVKTTHGFSNVTEIYEFLKINCSVESCGTRKLVLKNVDRSE